VEVEAPFAAASFDLSHVDRDRAAIDDSLFVNVTAIVVPTLAAATPTVAWARNRGPMAVSSQNTFFANYFGLPAVSVPITQPDSSLPMGVQFVGPHGSDVEVLALAAAYQQTSGRSYVPPPLARATSVR
jgi:aspartyl-tRNA(Asn)/glutamyl-tRNA(Gln) amidotransferase subunit A